MDTYTFDISHHRYVQLLTDVKKFNKIADRMELPQISIELESTYKSFDPLARADSADLTWSLPQIDYYRGKIINYDVSIGDFSFIGTILHDHKMVDGERILHTLSVAHPGQTIPEEYRHVKPVCEHCELSRDRKTTYIVRNDKTGEHQQVGSTCFNVYLNCDASDVIRILKIITRISDVEGYEEKTRKRTKEKYPLFNVKDILKLSNSIIRLYGYHSRNEGGDDIPTADIVEQICLSPESDESKFWIKKIEENRNDAVDDAVVAAVSKWALMEENNSSYAYTLRLLLRSEVVNSYRFGVLCSSIESHKESVKKKLTVKREFSNEYFGIEGGKHDLSLKCIDKRSISGYNGPTNIFKLVDDKKNLFIWFHESGHGIKIGQIKKLAFKIKAHKQYASEKQTQIGWVKELDEYDKRYNECPEYNEDVSMDRVV